MRTVFISIVTTSLLVGSIGAHGQSRIQLRQVGFPSSYAECNALRDRNSGILKKLNEAHDQCLSSTSIVAKSIGSCSKAPCQGLHDQRDKLQEEASLLSKTCNDRVREHLAREAEQTRFRESQEQQLSRQRDIIANTLRESQRLENERLARQAEMFRESRLPEEKKMELEKYQNQYYDWVRFDIPPDKPQLVELYKDYKEIKEPKDLFDDVKEAGKVLKDYGKRSGTAWSVGKWVAGKWVSGALSVLDYTDTYSVGTAHSYCDNNADVCIPLGKQAATARDLDRQLIKEFERYEAIKGGGNPTKGRLEDLFNNSTCLEGPCVLSKP